MKTNLLIKAIPSDANDILTRIKLGRTLYGQQGVHAGVLDDPWCSLCKEEDDLEIEDSLAHSNYSCPHVFRIIRDMSKYFLVTIPTSKDFILGVTKSNIDHTLDKQYGCLISSLLYNLTVHLITKRRRACQPLVGSQIIKDIISNLQSFTAYCPTHRISGMLKLPSISHFLVYNEDHLLLE